MLEVKALESGYGDRTVLRGIDFTVDQGETVAVLGANGAGKTTLLRTLSGLVRPRSGRVRFDSRDITRMPAYRIVRQGISLVPEGRQVFSRLTVLENLRLGAYACRDPKRIRSDIDEVFGLFPRLEERAGQQAGSLSGGEQQMLAMGRALMSRPRLLLLDEPSMGLAPKLVSQIYRIVEDINRAGTTILVVEQNARVALRVSRRAYIMENGSLVLNGDSGDLIRDDRVRKAYLGES